MADQSRQRRSPLENAINSFFGSSWVWGTAITLVFYSCVPYIPIFEAEIQKYFCSQEIQYLQTCLFLIACCTLFGKVKRLSIERRAIDTAIADGFIVESGENPVAQIHQIRSRFIPSRRQGPDTLLAKTVRDACDDILRRGSTTGLEEFLAKAILALRNRLQESYVACRLIAWSLPILGLLGTVVGFALAIAKIDPTSVDSSLGVAISAVSASFDPTIQALGLSMTLVFGVYCVGQVEKQLVDDIEAVGLKPFLMSFIQNAENTPSPLVVAETQIAGQLLQHSETMIRSQLKAWEKSLEELRGRWNSSLAIQQDSLDRALQAGMNSALANHSQQLERSRSDFLTAFQSVSELFSHQLMESRQAFEEQQQTGCRTIAETWTQFRTEITQTRDDHAKQLALLTRAISAELGAWQEQLKVSAESMNHQAHALRSQGDIFLKITENESHLIRLEKRLTENLEAVKVVDSLEQTLQSLNAVINLLTSRVKTRAA